MFVILRIIFSDKFYFPKIYTPKSKSWFATRGVIIVKREMSDGILHQGDLSLPTCVVIVHVLCDLLIHSIHMPVSYLLKVD